ncbi:MAG: cell division protein ZapE [Rickettsiaceae bacterium]|nr:cell division protein ZapE [Rickettsiaceae bacterium]
MTLLDFFPRNIKPDSKQIKLINILDKIKKDISRNYVAKVIQAQRFDGIYLYGPPGTGKSVIMSSFLQTLGCRKILYHYQEFINYIHSESRKLSSIAQGDQMKTLFEKIADDYDVVLIDELEIRDISDAMLIQKFSNILHQAGVFICFTTNIPPKDLYKNGVQRELFYPFIELIDTNFLCYKLDNKLDYRHAKDSSVKRCIFEKNYEEFAQVVASFIEKNIFAPGEIEILGRKVYFKKMSEEILIADISEISERDLAYNDFLEIAKRFKLVILKASDPLPNDPNVAIRFVNFIDNIYFNKLLLICYFPCAIEDFYNGSKYKREFKRAVSRIAEMSSSEYAAESKFYRKTYE